MSKSYAVFGKLLTMGERKGETVYSVRPVSYGTLTTDGGEADLQRVYRHACRREGGARPLRLLRNRQPEEGLQHRAAWFRHLVPPLHHRQGGDGQEEGERQLGKGLDSRIPSFLLCRQERQAHLRLDS